MSKQPWPKCERCGRRARFVVKTDYEQFVSCEAHQLGYELTAVFPIGEPRQQAAEESCPPGEHWHAGPWKHTVSERPSLVIEDDQSVRQQAAERAVRAGVVLPRGPEQEEA